MPNLETCYRLYQDDETYINAEVCKSSNEHENRMINFVKKYNLDIKGFEFITNGYFFTKFFICQGKESLIVDLNKKKFHIN